MSDTSNPRHLNAAFTRRSFLRAGLAGLAVTALHSVGLDLTPEQTAAAAARRQSGTLSVGWGGAPSVLDPLFASADVEIAFLNAVYDYLLDTNSDYEIVPRLATEWSVSDDGLVYTFQIAENVTFHDGSPLMIEDIVWTFERLKSDGPTQGLYANVVSVDPGEGNSVVFTLEETNPDFLYDLTDNHAVILQRDAADIGETFNGTGPFKLDDLNVDRAVLSANADYWNGAPAIETLEFVYFDDVEGAINALRGGQIDVVLRMDNATFLAIQAEGGFAAQELTTSGHDLVRIRADQGAGEKVEVRQALRMATDRQAIFDRIQLGFGSVGRDSPIAPVFAAYYTEETPLPGPDPEGAKALLEQAGYPDGLDLVLNVPDLADRVALAETLKAQWEPAGIRVTIERHEEGVYYAENIWLEADLAITPWGARPTPQTYLNLYVKSDAPWNEAHWQNEEVDELIALAGSTLDEEQRKQAYAEIQRIMIERGPIIIPYFFAQFGVMAEDVSGVDVHPFAGRTNFTNASL